MNLTRLVLRGFAAGGAGAALAAPANASAALGGGEDLHVSLWRIVVALLVAVVLAVLAALLIRKRGGRIDSAALFGRVRLRQRAIEVVETRRLSPHADICLVRHGQREYLLLLGTGHGQVLSCAAAEAGAVEGESET